MKGLRICPIVLSTLVAGVLGGFSGAASADPSKQRCVADNEEAQNLRRSGHFAAASKRLDRCADPACPAVVRDDCSRLLDEIERAQPSFVFDVRDPSGIDIIGVRILVDGTLLTDHLDGRPLKVDPGVHEFTFDVPGQPTVTERLLVREGEAGRHERVVVGAAPAPLSSSSTTASPRTATQREGLTTQQGVGLSLAGLGAAGIAIGTIFGLLADSAWSDAKRICEGGVSVCVNARDAGPYGSRAQTDASVSTAAFVAGGAILVGGAVTYFTGREPEQRSSETIAVAPTIEGAGLGVTIKGTF